MFDLNELKSIKIGLASPEEIKSWGRGEVTKPETINYRSQRPEDDGLFCQKIFGPVKDYECGCGKYKKRTFAGKVCDRCGVEVTLKSVRRERMGYITLAFPCTHIWYVKGAPSKMSLVLGIPPKSLEEVVYFISSVVINPGQSNILHERDVIDEKTARKTFAEIIQREIIDAGKVKDGELEYVKGMRYLHLISNENQPLDIFALVKYVNRHLGAEIGRGAEAVQRLLREIDLDAEIDKVKKDLLSSKGDKNQKRIKAMKRLEVLESFKKSGIKPEWMVLSIIPVIPPDLRPMMQLDGGRYATSDLNDLYRQVIIKNNRLKKEIEEHAPQVILVNEKRMLQEAVDALIDNERRNKPSKSGGAGKGEMKSLSSTLKGKQGRFRQNLLGKRVDYSGRSVIAVGPELNMDECGLPREMAVQLFRPYIAHYLIHEMKDSGITSQRQADDLIARMDPRVYDAVEEVVKDRYVLLNRAPTLHRLGIQAFKPKLIEGKAIRLHPLVCPGFNADFDGDQMAVHVPLSVEAQTEAEKLMAANRNILKPSDGKPICVPSQDMIFGNYYLTLEDDSKINDDYARYYEKRGEPDQAEKFRNYSRFEGKVFADPDTAILAYQNGTISLKTRIYVPGKSLKKTNLSPRQNEAYLLTTVGKLIFNRIFPEDFPYINFPFKGDKKAKKDYEENFNSTPDSFFVTPEEARQFVIDSGKFAATDDFDPFREYCKLQPLRKPIDKNGIKVMMDHVFRRYGDVKTAYIMDLFKNQGFDYCTKSGLTISLGDMTPLEGRQELYTESEKKVSDINDKYDEGFLTEEERHKAVIDVWTNLKDGEMSKRLAKRMAEANRNPMFMMMESGARGSTDNYMQLIGMKGCMLDSTGKAIEVPVKSSYVDGLSVSEYFTSTHGTRKNGADTALKTADSGYLTRKLVDVSHNVVVREEDCHSDHGVIVRELRDDNGELISNLFDRLVGRYPVHDIYNPQTGELIVDKEFMIDEAKAQEIVDAGITEVEIRSVLTCDSKDGVCVHCYGRNLATGRIVEIGDTVGIMAAQSIGEPGTQLTLKNFHTGGVAGQKDITTGLPRVTELLEARKPKNKDLSLITQIEGEIVDMYEEGKRQYITVRNDVEEKIFVSYPFSVPCVSLHDHVVAGQALTKGHVDLRELLACTDLQTVRNYIIKEVKAVYAGNGIAIADKHLEIIVRQMTNKLLIVNPGETDLLPGIKVDPVNFTDKNDKILRHGGNPAVGRPVILGITKAALDTDSFLSAASFQETTRVLTDAAIKGKVDYLHGLKENVMIGKLIPAGTTIRPLVTPSEDDVNVEVVPSQNIPEAQLIK